MGYSKEVKKAAALQLELSRKRALDEAENRKAALYVRIPRAKEIERALGKTAVQAARAVLTGNNARSALEHLHQENLSLQQELSQILRDENLPADYLSPHFHCTLCQDEGYIDGKMCACLKQLLRNEAYNRLNRLSPLALSTFDSFSLDYYSEVPQKEGFPSPRKRMTDIFRYCKNYAAEFNLHSPNLLMQGATGLGKTHLSLAIAQVAINKGYGVIYVSAPNIVSQLEKERFRYQRGDGPLDSEQHLMECDLLILDDLGTEFTTNFSNAVLYNILNTRMMAEHPTIISTNLSMKELERVYSERLVSRIMGNLVRLYFMGNDIRQQKKKLR